MAIARRDLIVVGASSGGLTAIDVMLRALPRHLPAAVIAVLHQPAHGRNMLVGALQRATALPVHEARDGAAVEPGNVYVPPLDRHLLVKDGRFELSHGPRENFVRPAIDPLFRSAARSFGARTIGVILSGTMDDGTAGLLAVKRRGGVAIVQDPASALQPGMPASALEFVKADHVAPPAQIAEHLTALAGTPVPVRSTRPTADGEVEVQAKGGTDMDMDLVNSLGAPSAFTCPSCNGVLWEIKEGELTRYRCHTGHAFGVRNLIGGKEADLEVALWTALRALKEKLELNRRLVERARAGGVEQDVRRSKERLEVMERQVLTLRELLERM